MKYNFIEFFIVKGLKLIKSIKVIEIQHLGKSSIFGTYRHLVPIWGDLPKTFSIHPQKLERAKIETEKIKLTQDLLDYHLIDK